MAQAQVHVPAPIRDKWARCDICNVARGSRINKLLTRLQCRGCSLQVHQECYDAGGALAATHAAVPTTHPLHGVMSATFLCHPCNDGIQPWGLTCELCHFNVDINQQPSNADVNETVKRQAQAFHQIKKAKWRLRRPDESGNKFVSREFEFKCGGAVVRRYCHTICGYGNRQSGNTWGCDKNGDLDGPFHHFQLESTKPDSAFMMKFEIATARLDNERDELEADRKNCKTVLDTRAEFIRGGRCPSDKKEKKKSDYMDYRCYECGEFDEGTRRILTQCMACDDTENRYLAQYHKTTEPCTEAFHFGCRRYLSNHKCVYRGKTIKPPRIIFYPGLSDFIKLFKKALAHPGDEFQGLPSPQKIATKLGLVWDDAWNSVDDVPNLSAGRLNKALRKVMKKATGVPTFNEIVAGYCTRHASEIFHNLTDDRIVGQPWEEEELSTGRGVEDVKSDGGGSDSDSEAEFGKDEVALRDLSTTTTTTTTCLTKSTAPTPQSPEATTPQDPPAHQPLKAAKRSAQDPPEAMSFKLREKKDGDVAKWDWDDSEEEV